MKEIWKFVKNTDEKFEVSNLGRIRLSATKEIRNQHVNWTGYYNSTIYRTDLPSPTQRVHRMVAEVFVPNPHGYVEVNHKDGNKANNRADNLEWCSRGQNIKHAYDLGLRSAKGENNARSILTEDKVAFARGLRAIGLKKSEIMSYLGLTNSLWGSVLRHWKHVQPTQLKVCN